MKFFKGKNKMKQIKEEQKEPRKFEEIKAQYEQLRARSGDVQYQIYALTKDLEKLNEAMVSVNYEAAARQKLDSEAAEKAKKEEDKGAV